MDRNPGLLTLKVSIIITFLLSSCDQQAQIPSVNRQSSGQFPPGADVNPYPQVGAIPLPAGYHRLSAFNTPFALWLRQIPLKKSRTVFLYNGKPKLNQEAQYAVLDVSVGNKDLQQCADAVMRLRAEFLYAQHSRKDLFNIDFYTEQRVRLNFLEWENGGRVHLAGDRLVSYTLPGADKFCDSRACFDDYLQTVFSYCGTLSLEHQLDPVVSWKTVQPGDVLIRGGSPGHAMIVMDVAEDNNGHRIYLLAQSYMPAQDIHIVKNLQEPALGPWYRAAERNQIIRTPEYTFNSNELRRWPQLKVNTPF